MLGRDEGLVPLAKSYGVKLAIENIRLWGIFHSWIRNISCEIYSG